MFTPQHMTSPQPNWVLSMIRTWAHITRKQYTSRIDVVQPQNWNAALLKPMPMLVKPASVRLHLRDRPIRQSSRHRLGGTIKPKVLVTLPVHVDDLALHM